MITSTSRASRATRSRATLPKPPGHRDRADSPRKRSGCRNLPTRSRLKCPVEPEQHGRKDSNPNLLLSAPSSPPAYRDPGIQTELRLGGSGVQLRLRVSAGVELRVLSKCWPQSPAQESNASRPALTSSTGAGPTGSMSADSTSRGHNYRSSAQLLVAPHFSSRVRNNTEPSTSD